MSDPSAFFPLPPESSTAGPSVRFGNGIVTILLDSAATNGAYNLFDELTDAGGGTPPHIHSREAEAFFILDDEFEFCIGDQVRRAVPGDFLIGPKGIPHAFQNLGSRPARKLVLTWPAGLDRFFLEAGTPVADPANAPPGTGFDAISFDQLATILAKYGMTLLPPSEAGAP